MFRANIEKAFDEFDVDRNNRLDKAEFIKFFEKNHKEAGLAFDGKSADQLFEDMDVNRNNVVDREEFIDYI